ncbi:hypothetical protein AMECASPLE_020917 [Ameca splendens]|uniref:Secreted protein n=1 Tax=Ameca splendens TaxID=208324 RepID=A0ABV0Z3C9_9TELE
MASQLCASLSLLLGDSYYAETSPSKDAALRHSISGWHLRSPHKDRPTFPTIPSGTIPFFAEVERQQRFKPEKMKGSACWE